MPSSARQVSPPSMKPADSRLPSAACGAAAEQTQLAQPGAAADHRRDRDQPGDVAALSGGQRGQRCAEPQAEQAHARKPVALQRVDRLVHRVDPALQRPGSDSSPLELPQPA